jgi:hypothetical protein
LWISGPQPARYLALRFSRIGFRQSNGQAQRHDTADRSVELGGWYIEYEDEDAEIHRIFEADG